MKQLLKRINHRGLSIWSLFREFFYCLLPPYASDSYPLGKSLERLFRETDFKLVDIGARRGAMSALTMLAPFARYYACEPDRQEAQTLAATIKNSGAWQEVIILPEALHSEEGEQTLFITKDPGYSSLLAPNFSIVSRFKLDERFKIESKTNVSTLTLDHAAQKYGFTDACFLKLDTQGTELDILRSGKQLVTNSLLGVYVEAEFHPFYKNQPLFSEIDQWLRQSRFSLFDLHRSHHRRASCQGHLDLYSKPQAVWAHALYLKEPEEILALAPERRSPTAAQLLGLALAFEHYDLALELTDPEHSRILFSDHNLDLLHNEVKTFAYHRTKVMLKRARSRRPPCLRAAASTDKNQE